MLGATALYRVALDPADVPFPSHLPRTSLTSAHSASPEQQNKRDSVSAQFSGEGDLGLEWGSDGMISAGVQDERR